MQNIEENNLILVIDVGTQSLKVSIVDDKGETIAIHKNVYKDPYFSPKNGYVEQYPNFYYDKIAESCQIIKKSNEKEGASVKKFVKMTNFFSRTLAKCGLMG